METDPDDIFKFSIDYLLNEKDKEINVEKLFKIPEWIKFLFDNYCIIPENIDLDKEAFIANLSYTTKQKENNSTLLLNILYHPNFKSIYTNFWKNCLTNLHNKKLFFKLCKSFLSQLKIGITSYINSFNEYNVKKETSKQRNNPTKHISQQTDMTFINLLLNYLDDIKIFDTFRLFILKIIDFQFISKNLSTKSQLIENIINGNLTNWTQERNNQFIYNIIKCGITCFTFQKIINNFIPDINIEPNADVLFFISGCYSIVDGLIDNQQDNKETLKNTLNYIDTKLNYIQDIIFTPNLSKKNILNTLLEYNNQLQAPNPNLSLIEKQINFIFNSGIDMFLQIIIETNPEEINESMTTLKTYINIIRYNFKLELHCHKYQKDWSYCSKFQNIFGLTICKGIAMGYLSSLQNNTDNFNHLIKLSKEWDGKYDDENGLMDNIPPVGIFHMFSILIQLLDDTGDYKEDKHANIITSTIFPIFNNPVLKTSLSFQILNNTIFQKYINSTYIILFTYFYHIVKINTRDPDTDTNSNPHINIDCDCNNKTGCNCNNKTGCKIKGNNDSNTDINRDLKMIILFFHQFFYYSITKNNTITENTILDKMKIDKYYLFDSKTIMKLRKMKNENKSKLTNLFNIN